MKPLWTVATLAQACHAQGSFPTTAVTGVSIDTRTLQPGDAFVALSGTPSGGFQSSFDSKGDGHNFVQMAQDKGAACVVVNRPMPGLTIPQIIVPDTLMDGLWAIGRAARARFQGHVVGLTGSAGKSTTKEYLAAALGAHASPGSYNNFWGVPLTLARLPEDAPYAVIEMGMNQPGEITRLSTLARPHTALVVNVRPVHLELMGSLAAIAAEKLSITDGLEPGGALVLPAELTPPPGIPTRFFAPEQTPTATTYATHTQTEGSTWHVQAVVEGTPVTFSLQQGAPHRLWNALAALATAAAAGVNPTLAATRLGAVQVMEGRGAEHTVGGITVLDDSFNGNPASMRAALEALKSRPTSGRKIAVVGDMLELGAEAPAYHQGLAPVCEGLSGVICVGPLMKNLYQILPAGLQLAYHEDPETFTAEELASHLQQGDTVVVKGSKKIFYVHNTVKNLLKHLATN